jgi:hypothetical protein
LLVTRAVGSMSVRSMKCNGQENLLVLMQAMARRLVAAIELHVVGCARARRCWLSTHRLRLRIRSTPRFNIPHKRLRILPLPLVKHIKFPLQNRIALFRLIRSPESPRRTSPRNLTLASMQIICFAQAPIRGPDSILSFMVLDGGGIAANFSAKTRAARSSRKAISDAW